MSRRKDSAAHPEVSQPYIHEAINAYGKLIQEVEEVGGGCKVKAWLVKLVIGSAGGGNAISRFGLQAYRI